MKKTISDLMTPEVEAELKALAEMPEGSIDTSEIPKRLDWSGARCGLFYRPLKKQLTLRLDADIIDWFKTRVPEGEGYQTRINAALREYVAQHAGK